MRFRDINRWHVVLAVHLTLVFGFLAWTQLMRLCAPVGFHQPNYCSIEETWSWIMAGGDWSLWTFVGFYASVAVGVCIGPDASRSAADRDQRS